MIKIEIKVFTLKDIPSGLTRDLMERSWPRFMTPDKETMKYWSNMRKMFPDYQLCLFDDDKLVGVGNSVPLEWSGNQEDLPSSWTDVLVQGVENNKANFVNTLSAVNIVIHSDYQRAGLSRILLTEFKKLVHKQGLQKLIIPVRPSFKRDYPLIPFNDYINMKREDGTPFDPWIRTHWKMGAKIIKPIPNAFTVKGSIKDWEEWTGMSFPETGSYVIKGALQSVQFDVENDIGIYNDPNVWMEYEY